MRVNEIHGKRKLYILIRSNSTHNFFSEQLASKLGCSLSKVVGVRVMVANGQDLDCVALCEGLEVKIQGQVFVLDAYLTLN